MSRVVIWMIVSISIYVYICISIWIPIDGSRYRSRIVDAYMHVCLCVCVYMGLVCFDSVWYRPACCCSYGFWMSLFLPSPPPFMDSLLTIVTDFSYIYMFIYIGDESHVRAMEIGGNSRGNAIFEATCVYDSVKPNPQCDHVTRLAFIREKYEWRNFVDMAAYRVCREDTNGTTVPTVVPNSKAKTKTKSKTNLEMSFSDMAAMKSPATLHKMKVMAPVNVKPILSYEDLFEPSLNTEDEDEIFGPLVDEDYSDSLIFSGSFTKSKPDEQIVNPNSLTKSQSHPPHRNGSFSKTTTTTTMTRDESSLCNNSQATPLVHNRFHGSFHQNNMESDGIPPRPQSLTSILNRNPSDDDDDAESDLFADSKTTTSELFGLKNNNTKKGKGSGNKADRKKLLIGESMNGIQEDSKNDPFLQTKIDPFTHADVAPKQKSIKKSFRKDSVDNVDPFGGRDVFAQSPVSPRKSLRKGSAGKIDPFSDRNVFVAPPFSPTKSLSKDSIKDLFADDTDVAQTPAGRRSSFGDHGVANPIDSPPKDSFAIDAFETFSKGDTAFVSPSKTRKPHYETLNQYRTPRKEFVPHKE